MKSKYFFSNPLLNHTLVGGLIGYFIFHPITMIVHDLWNYLEGQGDFYFWSGVLDPFRLEMLPMAIFYTFVGGIVGFIYGNYAKKIFEKNEELRRINEQLKEQIFTVEKQASLGVMAGSIGHEIKNILTAIMGYSQYLQLKEDISQKIKSEMDKIHEATTRLDKLAQTLLNLGRPRNVQFNEINICKIVDSVTDTLNESGILKRIKIEKEYNDCNLIIKGDPFLFEQVILNLEINAAQAMNYNGILYINIEKESNSQFIKIKIRDTGPGIPEEYLSRIFEPFFTTKPEGIGNGLGLNIVQQIIKDMGGTIVGRNSIEGGAEFIIQLPYNLKISN